MENFSQDNEAVAAIGAAVAASGAQGLATAAAAAAALTGLAPAGADEVSVQAATAFAAADTAEGERLNEAGNVIDASTQ